MSAMERELRSALTEEARVVTPSPDLLSRVKGSVDDDRRNRRRRLVVAPVLVLAVGAVLGLLVLAMTTLPARAGVPAGPDDRGGPVTWWMLELGTTVALAALAVWLGPFIKRFGRAYAADVFHDNPLTGKSYIVLTDIVYYLIFTAYILLTVHVQPAEDWVAPADALSPDVTAAQVQWELQRVAGILLIIGLLHGVNIVLMPVLGRLFSLNRRLPRPTTLGPSERERIDN